MHEVTSFVELLALSRLKMHETPFPHTSSLHGAYSQGELYPFMSLKPFLYTQVSF